MKKETQIILDDDGSEEDTTLPLQEEIEQRVLELLDRHFTDAEFGPRIGSANFNVVSS